MKKIIEKSGLLLALALLCQVRAQVSGSFGGKVPGGRPYPYEAGAESGVKDDVPLGAEHGAYRPGGYQGYGGANGSPVGSQGGHGGYYPGDSFQGWNGGYYQGGMRPVGFGRPGRRPGFRPLGWYGNYNPQDGSQGGLNVGGRPMVGFGRPGRRPGHRPPFGPGWPNIFYPGSNLPGGYFPTNGTQEGYFISGYFYPVGKPQNGNNKPVNEEKPTQDETVTQAEEKPPQNDLAGDAGNGAQTGDLPVLEGNTEGETAVTVNTL